MAYVYALNNGNWSDPSVWGIDQTMPYGDSDATYYELVPQAGDTVFLNEKTITLDENTAHLEAIYPGNEINDVPSSSNCKGNIVVSTSGLTIHANNMYAGYVNLINVNLNSASDTLTTIGNLVGSNYADAGGAAHAVVKVTVGTLNHTGNVRSGIGNNCYGIWLSGNTCTVNISGGDIYGDELPSNGGLYLQGSSCTANITGNCYGHEEFATNGASVIASGAGSVVTIKGNIYTGGVKYYQNTTIKVKGGVIRNYTGNAIYFSSGGTQPNISLENEDPYFWYINNGTGNGDGSTNTAIHNNKISYTHYDTENYMIVGTYKFPALLSPSDVQKGVYNGTVLGTLPVTFVESNNVNCGTSMPVSF